MAAMSAPILMVLATNSSATSTPTHRPREDVAHVRRQAAPVTRPMRALIDLDRDHQRPGQHHRPKQAEAELGAGLRIGRDAARIVVGGAGDEARAEALGEALQGQGERERLREVLVPLLRPNLLRNSRESVSEIEKTDYPRRAWNRCPCGMIGHLETSVIRWQARSVQAR